MSNTNKTVLLLVDQKGSTADIRERLNEKGLISWSANDISHAIEELSDFTVATKPDVVTLEVSAIDETYDLLHQTFDPNDDDPADVSVLMFNDGNSVSDTVPQVDFDQLGALFCGETA